MNILFLDFASEKNRGDEAMQYVMLDQIRQRFPTAKITVMAAYGANQAALFDGHFDTRQTFGYRLVPGFRSTTNRLAVGEVAKASKLQASFYLLQVFVLVLLFALTPALVRALGYRDQVDAVRNADFVIWNGRNFRDRPGIGEIYDTFAMLANPLFVIAARKRMYALGHSIWDLKSGISRRALTFVCNRTTVVTCRESFSFEEAQRLGIKTAQYAEDLSFIFLTENLEELPPRTPLSDRKPAVAFTIVDWKEGSPRQRETYAECFTQAIRHCIDKGYLVRIVPQVNLTWESYDVLLADIRGRVGEGFDEGVEVLTDDLNSQQLMEIYRQTDLLIGSRMHSTIYCAFAGARVIAVPYDVGAKWHIVLGLGLNPDDLINYGVLTADRLMARIKAAEEAGFVSNYATDAFDAAVENRLRAFNVLPSA